MVQITKTKTKTKKTKKKKVTLKHIRELISQGKWVYDMPSGMKVERPEPLEHGHKITNEEMLDYVEYNGLGFCIMDYIMIDRMEDEELKKLWTDAEKSLNNVMTFLYRETIYKES